MSGSESRSAVVLALAEEFLERYRQGQRPSLKEYIDRHPELAAEIKEVFPAMALMENVALADESLAGDAARPATTTSGTTPQQLGDFRILREVGRGGMGIVYEAEQVSLGRHVALKVLPRKMLVDEQQRRRFEREAKAAAKLHHTNIVPVFGVGEHDGLPYYVMQFIHGLGLDDVLHELKHMKSNVTSLPQTLSTRGGAQGEGNGEMPASGQEVSAADVARSLLTGEFHVRTGALEAPELAESAPKAEDAILGSGSQGTDTLCSRESSSGQLSDSFTLSSSLMFPGSGCAVSSSKGKKATYWQSVAHIGVQVADALEYAHKQGIQHRDIKPSNLLLDTSGTVWVTDFGLARADNEDHLTQTGDIVGTLRYMPPEAFEGRADKRGDIYSLGLTLYELMALKPAFEERDRHQLIKQVTTEEPARLDKLSRFIPRDLVTIVHKAIDREPGRRYANAAEFASDLQRFLDDEPIEARRISSMERLGRWCRHHPGVATLTAALAVLLLAVTVASILAAVRFDRLAREEAALAENERQARRAAVEAKEQEAALRKQAEESKKQAEVNLQEAERQKHRAEFNFAKARKAVEDYFTTVSESQLLQVPGMQPLRRELLQSALRFYQDFLSKRGNDPAIRGELAAAFLRVAKIHKELDKARDSHQFYEQACRLYEALTKEAPESAEYRNGLAECYYWLGRNDEAIALWQKLIQPGQPRYQKDLAEAFNTRAVAHDEAGMLAEALQAYEQSLAIRAMLVRIKPDDPDAQRDLSATLNNIGVLLGKSGRQEEALLMYRRATEHKETAFAQAPQVILNGQYLATGQENIAHTEHRLGHRNEALVAYRRAVEVWRQLARDNPAVPSLHSAFFRACQNLALYQRELRQTAEAERTMRLARDAIDRLPSDGPEALFNLACVRAECSTLLGQGKDKPTDEERAEQKHEADLAIEALRKAIAAGFRDAARLHRATAMNALRDREEFKALEADLVARIAATPLEKLRAATQRLAQADPKNKRLLDDLATSQQAIALIQIDLGKLDQAQKNLQESIALREALVKDEPKNKQYQKDLEASRLALESVICLTQAHHFLELKNYTEAKTALAKIAGFKINDPGVWKERGRIYFALGQTDQATADFRKAVEALGDKDEPAEPTGSEADKLFSRIAADAFLKSLTAAVERNPEDMTRRWQRAEWYARHGRWKGAAADFKMVLQREHPYNAWQWAHAAPALAAAGDHEGYRWECREMLARFGAVQDPPTAERVAKICLLLPEASKEMERGCQLADRAVALGKNHEWEYYFVFCKGLADYRRANWRVAAKTLASLLPRIPSFRPELIASCHLVLAMAQHRQGQAKAAHEHMAQGSKLLDQYIPEPTRIPAFGSDYNHDWLITRLLHREAQTLIEGKEPQK
jgi:serine/threonine protein kinase